MKTKIAFVAFVALIFFPVSSFSGSAHGAVASYAVMDNGNLLVTVGTNTSSPSCNTVPDRFAIDLNSKSGKAWYATIIASWVTGKIIYIEGTGTCSIVQDSETVSYIYN